MAKVKYFSVGITEAKALLRALSHLINARGEVGSPQAE
jgi:hypothetical protein